MGLDNLKKKLQTEGTPKAKPKVKLPFQRIVIGEEKGKLKAKSVSISFEQWARDMEADYMSEEELEELENGEDYRPPRPAEPHYPLSGAAKRRETERRLENTRERYRRSGLDPPF